MMSPRLTGSPGGSNTTKHLLTEIIPHAAKVLLTLYVSFDQTFDKKVDYSLESFLLTFPFQTNSLCKSPHWASQWFGPSHWPPTTS